MRGFKIKITCNDCQSENIVTELTMNQGTGLLGIECQDCGNDNKGVYMDDEDLSRVVNSKRSC